MKKFVLFMILVTGMVSCSNGGGEKEFKSLESPVIAYDISNQKVTSIAEDEHGHIWIGTFRGLNRFNVHEYQQYFCTDQTNSLPDNQIQALFRDSQNRLWISTVNGMALYTHQDDFRRIPMEGESRNAIQILEDHSGKVFINTAVSLCEYDEKEEKFAERLFLPDSEMSLVRMCFITPDNDILVASSTSLKWYDVESMELKDSIALQNYPISFNMMPDGKLWMSSLASLAAYDLNTASFLELPSVFHQHDLFRRALVIDVHPYGDSSIIFITEHHGVFIYDEEDDVIRHQSEAGFPFKVPDVKVNCIFTDSKDNLWIGSYDQGYRVVYGFEERFNKDGWLKLNLEGISVVSVDCDSKDNLWISTLKDGLYLYDSKNQVFKEIDLSELFASYNSDKWDISMVFVDDEDKIWLTGGGGVLKCAQRNGELVPDGFWPVFMPLSLSQDADGRVWIGALGEYVPYISPEDDQMRTIKALSSYFTFIPDILPLDDGTLLIPAFDYGLIEVDIEENFVQKIPFDDSMWSSCIQRSVFVPSCMHQCEDGIVWIGTIANGLLKYDPSAGKISRVPGAPCLDIAAIEEDLNGDIWVSTQYGLGKLDRSNGNFINWFASDGIGGNQFYDRSSCRMSDGTMVFGGTHGLTVFNPAYVTENRDVSICFENLKVHNELVLPSDDGCITKALAFGPEITLSHEQNSFSISFAAVEYGEYDRVDYYYMLEGVDDHWIDAHNNREAYYSNVCPGKYVFKVRVMNIGQNEVIAENSIDVLIEYPLWQRWWAMLIYLSMAAIFICLIVKVRREINAQKAEKLKAQQEKEQEKKVNKMNMSFFANISHEFRTPLTMISGPVAQLQESGKLGQEDKRLLNIVQRNIRRMLRLVNQQLDFNKLENDTLKLSVAPVDIIEQLVNLTDIFRVTAEEKGIIFRTYGLEDSMTIWVDDDKLDKICFNLLSNAIKFTPSGGKVEFSIDVISRETAASLFELSDKDVDAQYVKIVVADSGDGIPENKLEKIFERYYQLENKTRGSFYFSTGIGLYFARTLARMHHGYLKAGNRTIGTGAVFTLLLPVSDISYSEAEKNHDEPDAYSHFRVSCIKYNNVPVSETDTAKKKILIVDDDMDVIHYLKELLSPYYEVIPHFNADSAYVALKEEAPELVVSDVVMPDKSGYELCREIKENIQLSHVPVILLTAKSTVDDQVQGLDCGADAYVVKPFEPQYLLALIQSQLRNREKIKEMLSRSTDVDNFAEDALSHQDSAFMTELYQLMENELSNSELDVSLMTEMLHISRTKFYYKVKGLTGENPSVFFKRYKLNRAAQLLKERRYNVSEIADMTGFSTLSHFSTSFKKQFGVSPSEYVK